MKKRKRYDTEPERVITPAGINLSHNARADRNFLLTKNMYIDRTGGGDALESIPGYRRIYSFDEKIHSLFETESRLFVHSGGKLYSFPLHSRDSLTGLEPICHLADAESYGVTVGEELYVTDGKRLIRVSADLSVKAVCEEDFIVGSHILVLFDGRIFASGNEKYPGRIFYSTPLSEGLPIFSLDTSLCDGVGGTKIVSMLPSGESLWVFKSNSDGGDGIICHSRESGYPVSRVMPSPAVIGGSLAAGGEIVFISKDGLSAIQHTDGESRVVCRSDNINPLLQREDLRGASPTLFGDYIAILTGGRIYLADTLGKDKYDWYLIEGIGAYKGARRVYRYLCGSEGYENSHLPKDVAQGEILSVSDGDERTYYVMEGDKIHYVYPTEQYSGGSLSPAELMLCRCGLLWLCAEGELFLMNTDKRGVAPDRIRSSPDFDQEEYGKSYGGLIHPDFYSFDRTAPEYTLVTHPDSCDADGLLKSSIFGSLILDCKSYPKSSFRVSVITDGNEIFRENISLSPPDFFDLDFASLTALPERTVRITLPEREAYWSEKQIVISSDGYCAPFGIRKIRYKCKIKGNMKNK